MVPRLFATGAVLGTALLLALFALPPRAAQAQSTASNPDFLFQSPNVTVTLRSGLFAFRANAAPGSFFDVTTDRFTTERSDFRGLQLGAELALAFNSQFDLTLAFDGGSIDLDHESRFFEELDGTPIFQSTRIRSGPTAQIGLRGYLLPRGEQLSSLAWVPRRFAPFVGAGAGYGGYDVRQWGDFAFTTDEGDFIQYDDLSGNGGAGLLYASGGADISIRRNLALTLEARYQWSDTELGGDFRFNDPTLDLSGLRLTAGLSARF